MNIVNLENISVSSKRFSNYLKFPVLLSNFFNQIIFLFLHALQKLRKEKCLVVNPGSLISDLSNLHVVLVAND